MVDRPLRLFLLGNLEIRCGGDLFDGFATQRGREIFAFLVLERKRVHSRVRLAADFWGHLPEARARKALNTEVWRLATALRASGADPDTRLTRTPREIGFTCRAGDWVDVDAFSSGLEPLGRIDPDKATDAEVSAIEDAVAIYRGDLLESVYSDWCFLQRETIRSQHVAGLEFLLFSKMARQDWPNAIRYGQRLLGLDPLMEHVHRAMMRCHYMSGNRPAAIRQYALCEQLLREELNVDPMEETRLVQETILSVRRRAPEAVAERAARRTDRPIDASKTPVQKIDLALANIGTAAGWLEDATRDLRNRR